MENIVKPKICFIGAGNVSENHINAAKDNGFILHGICGRKGSIKAKNIARKYNFNNYWQSIDEINTDQIDAISIIVDPINLIKIYKKFEATNLAILIEKPVALESRKIESLNEERSRTMVAFNRRYYSSVSQFKRDLSELSYFQGHANYSELSWKLNSTNKEKIHTLKSNGIHFLDLLLYLFGKPELIDFNRISNKSKILGGSFIINFGLNKIMTLNINFGIPNNHSLELFSENKVIQLKPLEVYSKTVGMKHNTIGRSKIKSYVPVLGDNWKMSKHDVSHKAGFLEMYRNFLGVTKNDCELNFPNLKEAKNALEFAENIELLLRSK
jgi:predicted dehydrogenase